MVPFLVVFMLTEWGGAANRYISVVIFAAASITDWFDGYLARKNHLVTNFGKFMDPLADKLLVCAALICLVELARIPSWVVIVIISREFIISGFRLVASDNGVVIAASYWGKFKTTFQMLMICLMIANLGGIMEVITQVCMWIALLLTLVSLIDYLWKNKAVMAEQKWLYGTGIGKWDAAEEMEIGNEGKHGRRADFCRNRNITGEYRKH